MSIGLTEVAVTTSKRDLGIAEVPGREGDTQRPGRHTRAAWALALPLLGPVSEPALPALGLCEIPPYLCGNFSFSYALWHLKPPPIVWGSSPPHVSQGGRDTTHWPCCKGQLLTFPSFLAARTQVGGIGPPKETALFPNPQGPQSTPTPAGGLAAQMPSQDPAQWRVPRGVAPWS